MRYLLPCECGRKIPVAKSQAGDTLTCECGRTLAAPKLRDMVQLETAPDEAPVATRRLTWSERQGVMFAGGAVMLILGALVFTLITLQRRSLHTEKPAVNQDDMATYLAEIDRNTPTQNLELWEKEILQEGLQQDPQAQAYLTHRRIASVLNWIRLVAGAISVAGLGLVVAAFVLRPRARPTPR
jgi:hypothetical protein